MPRLFAAFLTVFAGPALAHPGHLAGLAGHDHWVAGAAIGLAAALGLWGALKGRGRAAGKDDEGSEDSKTPQEA